MDGDNHFSFLYNSIVANTSAIWQQVAHTTNHHLLAVQQKPYKKAYLLPNSTGEFPGKKIRRKGYLQKKVTTERANKTGGRNRESNNDSSVILDSWEHQISQTSRD